MAQEYLNTKQEAAMMKVAQTNTMPSEQLDPSTWQANLDQASNTSDN
ncbi:hypothetical protein COLO4_10463 [Corchorus olitorius]|uniref:Uncharacterized protein n=1 Tax=Corchorus olitorius TaxID=93759 RepID=A0A1R3K8G9_9ROSI|nr:hypothetical protein COLO4_10463 [Corchorus olitorius]